MKHYSDPWAQPEALRGRSVLLAMSGGVDSSAAAVLLQRRGARVLGMTMKNFCYSDVDADTNTSCCSVSHTLDARAVCEQLDIPHYVLDVTQAFGKAVMQRFVSEYEAGRTPNPCVDCNQTVRFPVLLQQARTLGADLVATGHYTRSVCDDEGRWFLRRGCDTSKDQSYFLHGVPQRCIARSVFPLGALHKTEVRAVAREAGLRVASKSESQEICFVPDGERRAFLQEHGNPQPGEVVDGEGTRLGTHDGIGNFTVGQRRGLNVAVGHPVYVQRIDAASNTVVLGDENALGCDAVQLEPSWLRGAPDPRTLHVQVRYRSRPVAVRSLRHDEGSTHVVFESPQRAVAPGQAAVLYDGDVVVGGGRIFNTASA